MTRGEALARLRAQIDAGSPIIGAGLYVDNEVGAATASGSGAATLTPQPQAATRRATSDPSSTTGTAPFRQPSYSRFGNNQSEFCPAW